MNCYGNTIGKCRREPECEHACALRIQPVVREHVADEKCWCFPVIDYTDPETGVSVYLHKEPQ